MIIIGYQCVNGCINSVLVSVVYSGDGNSVCTPSSVLQ